MDGYNNRNRSSGAPQIARPVAARPVTVSENGGGTVPTRRARKGRKLWFWIGGIVIVIALLVTAYLLFFNPDRVKGSQYQAVFLSNGQVYFGKLHGFYGDHPYLTDVYYIQAQDGSTDSKATTPNSNSQLIRLGEEVHKPENLMLFNKSSILFVENLQTDSQVSKLIESNDKSSSSSATSAQPEMPTTTAPAPTVPEAPQSTPKVTAPTKK